jgi:transposase
MAHNSPSFISNIVRWLGFGKRHLLPPPPKEVLLRGIEITLSARERSRLEGIARNELDHFLARRYRIVILRSLRYPYLAICQSTGASIGLVSKVLGRFRQYGQAGLVDRREDNGELKLDGRYLRTLYRVLRKTAPEWGWARPTWTREMLIMTMERETGIRVSLASMSRALFAIRARRGRPKPIATCPWPEAQKARCLKKIQRLIKTLPSDQVAFWSDEVDVNLNPKIGSDWMNEGYQRKVLTPGTNVKRYIAGAMHVRSRKMTWVWGEHRNSALFIDLMMKLSSTFRRYRVIHLIVDNGRFHKPDQSRQIKQTLEAFGGRIVLHYLPTYSPDDNPIERFWEDFHAAVTRNHQCTTIETLMHQADNYLEFRNNQLPTSAQKAIA